jgi:phosphoglycolate phosphatase
MSLRPAIARLAPADAPDEVIERLQTEYVNAFVKRRASGVHDPLYDGARDLLERMKADGWLMAVASGKSRAGLTHIFAAHDLETMFDTVHCADDGPGKPDPHMLVCALRAMGAAAPDAIMVGDTSHDMVMARAAGVYAQGVIWGFHTRDELHASGAHHVAEDFAALNRALAAFKR